MLGVTIRETLFREGASPINIGVISCQVKGSLMLWAGYSASADSNLSGHSWGLAMLGHNYPNVLHLCLQAYP